MLAAIRPDDWNLPLLLHLAAAMVLVGTLIVAAATLVGAARSGGAPAVAARVRSGYRTLLLAVLPSFLVMRVSAEWIVSEEDLGDDPPAWVDVGYMTTDFGALLLIVAIIAAGLGARRLRREPAERSGLASVAGAISLVLLAAYLVAIWVMTTKPD